MYKYNYKLTVLKLLHSTIILRCQYNTVIILKCIKSVDILYIFVLPDLK